MNDCICRTCMKVVQPMCCTNTDLESLLPRKWLILGVIEMVTKGPMSHIIIHENHLVIIITISNQKNEMEVAESRQHLDFCLELLGSLLRTQDYLVCVE